MPEFENGQLVAAELNGEWRIGLWRGLHVLEDGKVAAKVQTGTESFIYSGCVRHLLQEFPDAAGIPVHSEKCGMYQVGQRVSTWSDKARKVYDGYIAKADPVAWCYHVIRDNGGGEYYTEKDLAMAILQARAVRSIPEDDG